MTASVPFVEETFRHFNALCFGGSLPDIPVVLTHARTFLGKMEFKTRRGLFGHVVSYYDFRMRISVSFDLPQQELEDVVIHEMIHYYIALKNLRDTSSHGRVFRDMMHRINSTYGRNISVRHHGEKLLVGKPRKHHFCISTFRDGKTGITVFSPSKEQWMRRNLPRCFDIVEMDWYTSEDPFFGRFPRSRTPKIYKISPGELSCHMDGAQKVDVTCSAGNP